MQNKQKGFADIILVWVVVVLVVVGGFFVWKGNHKVAPETQPVATTTVGDTSNWKTYTNDKYGFEFQYPKDWYVQESIDKNKSSTVSGNGTLISLRAPDNQDYDVEIAIDKVSKEQLINKILQNSSPDQSNTKTSQENFLGFPATLMMSTFPTTKAGVLVFQKDDTSYSLGGTFESSDAGLHPVMNELLSTFKFTEPAESNNLKNGSGILTGHANVGPVCPVEQLDHPCTPSPEANMARQVGVFQGKNQIATQHLDANGNYKFTLPQGSYEIRASGMNVDQLSAIVGEVNIKAGQTTTLNFNIDTGIR